MFMGISAADTVKSVNSLAGAHRVLRDCMTTPTGRARKEKPGGYGFPIGGHSKSVTWARATDDGGVAFRLYETDVVTYQGDGSVLIENYGTTSTTKFANTFAPNLLHLCYPVTTRGNEGGHKGICYHAASERDWKTRRVCTGDVVRFVPSENGAWLPDATTIDPIRVPDSDRKATRAISMEHHLRDFELWLSMAPMHLDLEHDDWDLEACAAALKARDFSKAAVHLPLIEVPGGFGTASRMRPLNIAVRGRDFMITMGSLRKLKLALWHDLGAIGTTTVTTMVDIEHDKVRRLNNAMNKLGFYPDWGISS